MCAIPLEGIDSPVIGVIDFLVSHLRAENLTWVLSRVSRAYNHLSNPPNKKNILNRIKFEYIQCILYMSDEKAGGVMPLFLSVLYGKDTSLASLNTVQCRCAITWRPAP